MSLEDRVTALEQKLNDLQQVQDVAFKESLARRTDFVTVANSGKNTTTVTRAVNEGGSASYDVSNVPDGFFLIENKHVPFFN